jgi:hypothetical protein
MNPVDDFLKTAGWWDALKQGLTGGSAQRTMGEAVMHGLGQALPGAMVGAGLAAGAVGAGKGYGALKDRFSKAKDFKAMMGASPALKKHDAGQVQMVYNSLRSQSPSMAKDPLIAGSFVRRTLEVSPESGPFIDPQTTKMLSETQRNISQAKSGRGSIAEAFRPTSMNRLEY